MKIKYFFIAFLLMLGSAILVIGCNKLGEQNKQTTAGKTKTNTAVLKDLDDAGDANNCNCAAGYSSCNTSCLFSSCCICWNPATNEGGCGCWFGVALCKTEKKTLDDNPEGRGSSQTTRHISLNEQNITEYFEFLRSNGYKIDELTVSFEKLKSTCAYNESTNLLQVVELDSYDSFVDDYKKFTNSLSKDKQSEILAYIDAKEKKMVKH